MYQFVAALPSETTLERYLLRQTKELNMQSESEVATRQIMSMPELFRWSQAHSPRFERYRYKKLPQPCQAPPNPVRPQLILFFFLPNVTPRSLELPAAVPPLRLTPAAEKVHCLPSQYGPRLSFPLFQAASYTNETKERLSSITKTLHLKKLCTRTQRNQTARYPPVYRHAPRSRIPGLPGSRRGRRRGDGSASRRGCTRGCDGRVASSACGV